MIDFILKTHICYKIECHSNNVFLMPLFISKLNAFFSDISRKEDSDTNGNYLSLDLNISI